MSKLSKIFSGIHWGTVSLVIIIIFQLVFMAVMARILNPADFGLVAIANVALRFYSYFSQMGIAPALIQKEKLEPGDLGAALSISLTVSLFFFILAVSTAGWIEYYFKIDSLESVMQVLALNFIVTGVSSVSVALMRRESKFKSLAIIEIISYVIGYGFIGITAAYFGGGVWSLVAAFLTQMILTSMLSYFVVRFPLNFKHESWQRRHFIGYGGRYSLIGFIEFLSSNLDALIIGKLLGVNTAGYYNRAMLLANLPVQHPVNILTKALFPVLSTVSNDHDKQSVSIQLSVLVVACYAFPVSIGVWLSSDEIIRVLLGDKWVESIRILQVLILSVGPLYLSHVIGVTLDSMGELGTKLYIQITMLCLLVFLLVIAAPTGEVINIALAVVVTEWVRVFVFGYVVSNKLSISALNILKILLSVILVTFTTAVFIWFSSYWFTSLSTPIFVLLVKFMFAVMGLVAGLWLARHILSKHPAIVYLTCKVPLVSKYLVS